MSDWISVSERLPEEWDRVLVCNAHIDDHEWYYGVTEAVFAPCGKGCCAPKFESKGHEYVDNSDVTHWMHLPKPPKGNTDDNTI